MTLGFSAPLGATAAAASNSLIAPGLLFLLAVAGAVGMILLLPGRKEAPIGKIGGVVLAATLLVLAIVVGKSASASAWTGNAWEAVYFWIFAIIAVAGAIRVVTHPKPVYSALYFVLTVMASAGLFVLMWAEFMAAALVLIYGGAILVTYVFVIMLAAEVQPEGSGAMHESLSEHDAVSREPVVASAVGFALLGVLLFVIFDKSQALREDANDGRLTANAAVLAASDLKPAPTTATAAWVPQGNTQKLGNFLFNEQLINLELAGLILTVAMIGAIVIARKRVVNPQMAAAATPTGTEAIISPLTPLSDAPDSIPVTGTENPRQKEYPET